MRLLTTFTAGEWDDLLPSAEENSDSRGHEQELRQALNEFLRSQNLVILTGLGTSLAITGESEGHNEGTKSIAPTMGDLWTEIKGLHSNLQFDKLCKRVGQPEENDAEYVQDIEMLLSRCLLAQEFKPSKQVEDFISEAESTIVELCDFLSDDTPLPIHEAFLRRIARRPTRHPRTKLFTTNYDLAFETAASRLNFIAVDGFSHTLPQEFDSSYFSYDLVRRDDDGSAPDYIPNVFQLLKLHGSIDWEKGDTRIIKERQPKNPVLIYPRYSKYELSYESPYLDLMSRFQAALRQSDTSLLVIGFGFNDKHLTEPILSAIRGNVGMRTAIVSPSLEDSANPSIGLIEGLIKSGDTRLSLIAGSFQEFVSYLPDIVSESEEEQHRRRLREGA